jgi:hypothetical protein
LLLYAAAGGKNCCGGERNKKNPFRSIVHRRLELVRFKQFPASLAGSDCHYSNTFQEGGLLCGS